MNVYRSFNPQVAELTKSKRVMYIGVGNEMGEMSEGAKLTLAVAKEWHGIELDPKVIESYPELDIRKVDLNRELPDNLPEVDVIVMTEVLEHLESPVNTLRRLACAFPGCSLLASVPNCLSIGRILTALWSHKKYVGHDGNHLLLFNYRTLHSTLVSAGLKEINIYGYNRHMIFHPFVMLRPDFCVGFAFEARFSAKRCTD